MAALIATTLGSHAELDAEKLGRVNTLPRDADAHWLWVYDMVYDYMTDGRASLIDGDTGRFLGMLNTGYSFTQLSLPTHYREIYSAETYYTRYTRGVRNDVVSIYSPTTLLPVAEIDIPDKRGSTIPTPHNAVLTDDDQFLLVFNLTPATSITVVDVKKRVFVGEIETPGCSLIYPAGNRRFFSLCGDGSLLDLSIDDDGKVVSAERSAKFFDPQTDPISEKGVRLEKTWYFVSFEGYLHEITFSDKTPGFGKPWSLLSDNEREQTWRVGGTKHLALHKKRGLLYSIVHRGGGQETRKDPGEAIWVYDLTSRKRTDTMVPKHPTGLLEITQDDKPLLFTADVARNAIDVYDGTSGEFLRSVESIGYTPTGLETPVD
ncbi:MAG: amine dehydrogenase large subunit [Pseudomonadota bacterium]